jgi:hypothetical protein
MLLTLTRAMRFTTPSAGATPRNAADIELLRGPRRRFEAQDLGRIEGVDSVKTKDCRGGPTRGPPSTNVEEWFAQPVTHWSRTDADDH